MAVASPSLAKQGGKQVTLTLALALALTPNPNPNPYPNPNPNQGNMGINVATLIQETNFGSSRWFRSAAWVPEETLPLDRLLRPPPQPPPPPPPPLQGDTADAPRSSAG